MTNSNISTAGDHFLVGLRPSPTLDERDRALLRDLRPAGVIVYKSNFRHDLPYEEWLEIYAKLISDIRGCVGRERMFIAIDHEGGRVCRTPPPITRFSYAARWAHQAAAVGAAMGNELASLGVNLNFAPVLDVHSNPSNPVIGERAFGRTPEEVIPAALAFMGGMQRQGVLACGKHFPGHGDTDVDSHYELPVLGTGIDDLKRRELKPFAAAIAAGIPMIMTAHVLFPALDEALPVTLSRRFNHDLLRGEMGFDGVIISDDLGMRAVSHIFEDTSAGVRLLLAGCDMLMVCAHWTDTERCRGLAKAIVDAENCGDLPVELLAGSRARIATMLGRAFQHQVRPLPTAELEANKTAGALFAAETVEVI